MLPDDIIPNMVGTRVEVNIEHIISPSTNNNQFLQVDPIDIIVKLNSYNIQEIE